MSVKINSMFPALALVGLLAIPLRASDYDENKLHQLHAAFHAATSVHDPVNGDSPAAIDQRVRDVMSLWTDNGLWLFFVGSPFDGYYLGKGDPADPATCPVPSGNPANQGTMCTLVKYVLPPFQPGNKMVSLAPAYKSRFEPHGQMATIYFECHLFNVDLSTGTPPWTQAGHIAVNAVATKVNGQWRFSQIIATPAPVPIP